MMIAQQVCIKTASSCFRIMLLTTNAEMKGKRCLHISFTTCKMVVTCMYPIVKESGEVMQTIDL